MKKISKLRITIILLSISSLLLLSLNISQLIYNAKLAAQFENKKFLISQQHKTLEYIKEHNYKAWDSAFEAINLEIDLQ